MTSPTNIILPSISNDIDTTNAVAAANPNPFNNAPPTFPSPLTTAALTSLFYTSSTTTTASPSSSISITNGISAAMASPPPPPSLQPEIAWEEVTIQIDKFLQAASYAAYKKCGTNIAIISFKFSKNFLQNNVKDYIWFNKEIQSSSPTHYLVPFRNGNRIVLADFNVMDKQLGYYDTIKKPWSNDFFLLKYSIEKYLSIHFDIADPESINSTINDTQYPSFAHICRIAEEICFNGRNRKINPFVIKDEAERIKRLLTMISTDGWKGEWLSTIKDTRINGIIQEVIMGAAVTTPSLVNGQNVSPSVVGRVGNGQTAAAGGGSTPRKSIDGERRTIESINRRFNITQPTMEIYEKKYPVLSKMLKIYLNFTKVRMDRYKTTPERKFTVRNTFNYKEYIDMNHYDAHDGLKLFDYFPFLVDLQESEKAALIKRFREPFLMFERIYDTLNTVGNALDNQYIMLQNGDCFHLNTLNQSQMSPEMTNVFKVVFSSWNTLLPIVRKINPDIMEAVYIFCCILLNSSYLDIQLSDAGDEIVRRGRLIILKEMKEFYDYDDVQWERIYLLRHVMLITEDSVREYKKKVVNIV
uniref:NR LBD domain-containing protein n=1 Tax=Panagrolaimus davidi TaxID=227884 RepID=A0A914PP37_9BILA